MSLGDLIKLAEGIVRAEARVPHLRPGCEKRILWAGRPGARSPVSIIYVHGFSASAQELRPLPDLVAKAVGANLFFTRLTGHGQDGPALGRATLDDWRADMREAIEVGQAIGDHVVIIACSTGCPLAALALADGLPVAGLVQISPNYGLRSPLVQTLLDLPGSRVWTKYIVGRTRSFDPISPAHSAYWTTRYPTSAVHTMADTVRAALALDFSTMTTRTLFVVNPMDRVISPDRAADVFDAWGGTAAWYALTQGPGDDAMGHVMAGDIFSPDQTAPLAARIVNWLEPINSY